MGQAANTKNTAAKQAIPSDSWLSRAEAWDRSLATLNPLIKDLTNTLCKVNRIQIEEERDEWSEEKIDIDEAVQHLLSLEDLPLLQRIQCTVLMSFITDSLREAREYISEGRVYIAEFRELESALGLQEPRIDRLVEDFNRSERLVEEDMEKWEQELGDSGAAPRDDSERDTEQQTGEAEGQGGEGEKGEG